MTNSLVSPTFRLMDLPRDVSSKIVRNMNANELFFLSTTSTRFLNYIPELKIPVEISIEFELRTTHTEVSFFGEIVKTVAGKESLDGFNFDLNQRQKYVGLFSENKHLLNTTMPGNLWLERLFILFPTATIDSLYFHPEKNWENENERAEKEREFVSKCQKAVNMMINKHRRLECRKMGVYSDDKTTKFDQTEWRELLPDIKVTEYFEVDCKFQGNYIGHMYLPPKVSLKCASSIIDVEKIDRLERIGAKIVDIQGSRLDSEDLNKVLFNCLFSNEPERLELLFVDTLADLDPEEVFAGFEEEVVGAFNDPANQTYARVFERLDGIMLKVCIIGADFSVEIYNDDDN